MSTLKFSSKPAAIKKANEVSYKTKSNDDSNEVSHGSRPAQINKPGKKAKNS